MCRQSSSQAPCAAPNAPWLHWAYALHRIGQRLHRGYNMCHIVLVCVTFNEVDWLWQAAFWSLCKWKPRCWIQTNFAGREDWSLMAGLAPPNAMPLGLQLLLPHADRDDIESSFFNECIRMRTRSEKERERERETPIIREFGTCTPYEILQPWATLDRFFVSLFHKRGWIPSE